MNMWILVKITRFMFIRVWIAKQNSMIWKYFRFWKFFCSMTTSCITQNVLRTVQTWSFISQLSIIEFLIVQLRDSTEHGELFKSPSYVFPDFNRCYANWTVFFFFRKMQSIKIYAMFTICLRKCLLKIHAQHNGSPIIKQHWATDMVTENRITHTHTHTRKEPLTFNLFVPS